MLDHPRDAPDSYRSCEKPEQEHSKILALTTAGRGLSACIRYFLHLRLE
jgi:hypothetical protein